MIILLLLLVISIIVPYRLAFSDHDPIGWMLFYIISDTMFLVDIILTFMTSLYEPDTGVEIVELRFIARNYLKGWFWIDTVAILPLDIIMMSA